MSRNGKKRATSQPINRIRGRFKDEWLVIVVDRVDEHTSTPVTGHLLAHGKDRHAIFRRSISDRRHLMITYSQDTLPVGLAAALPA